MIEGAVKAYLWSQGALTGNLGGADSPRIYPDVAPTSAALPYVVFQELPGAELEHHGGAAGLANVLVQFSVFAATSISRETVAKALRAELLGYRRGTWGTGSNEVEVRAVLLDGAPFSTYVQPTNSSEEGVYQSTVTYRVWYRTVAPQF